jgi:hypothetical protein
MTKVKETVVAVRFCTSGSTFTLGRIIIQLRALNHQHKVSGRHILVRVVFAVTLHSRKHLDFAEPIRFTLQPLETSMVRALQRFLALAHLESTSTGLPQFDLERSIFS